MLVKECQKMGVQPKKLSQDAIECLVQYPWRGNIRERENFVRHIIVVTGQNVITSKDFQAHFIPTRIAETANAGAELPGSPDPPDHHESDHHDRGPSGERRSMPHEKADAAGLHSVFAGQSWEQVERAYVRYLLDKNRWHITRAAKEAGVNRSTFDSRMKRLGIRK
jgi:DNA-binding NtrC family response regulator